MCDTKDSRSRSARAEKFSARDAASNAREFCEHFRAGSLSVRAAKCMVESSDFDSTVPPGNGERHEESAPTVASQRTSLRPERGAASSQDSARPHRWNRDAEAS